MVSLGVDPRGKLEIHALSWPGGREGGRGEVLLVKYDLN